MRFKLCLISLLFLLGLILLPNHILADEVNIGEEFGFGNITDLGSGTTRLVTPLFSIAATLVVIYFLLGAFKYLKAGANKEDVEGARQMITHAIIGFGLLMLSFLVLQFLLYGLFGITGFQIIQIP